MSRSNDDFHLNTQSFDMFKKTRKLYCLVERISLTYLYKSLSLILAQLKLLYGINLGKRQTDTKSRLMMISN
jgi:hypothetical protein